MVRPKPALGDLQLAIVRVLWERGEATVAEVHDALRDRRLALTTIATMLRKLEEKGAVRHREQGRQFVYSAVIAADDVQAHMVGDLVERLFDGDPLQLLSHLVREGEIDLRELDALRAEIAAAQKRPRRGGTS
jgi:BlaI family penicillinase repressor